MWNDGTSLYHYGIQGQKWGLRRWQNEDGSFNYEGKIRYGRIGTNNRSLSTKESLNKKSRNEHKNTSKERKKIDKEKLVKMAKIGLTVAGAYMAYKYITNPKTNLGRIVSIYKEWGNEDPSFSDMDAMHTAIQKVDTDFFDKYYVSEFASNHPDEWKTLQDTFGKDDIMYNSTMMDLFGSGNYYDDFFNSEGYSDETWANLVKDLNPGWPKSKEISNNCMLCTMSLVMRLKGYDPQAALSGMGWHDDMLKSWWGDDIQTIDFPSSADKDTVINSLLNNGNDHYGNFTLTWSTGGGHSILYAVKNGEVHFIDGQIGREYNTDELFKMIDIGASTFTDLTDATPRPRIAAGILSKTDRDNATLKPNHLIGMISEFVNYVSGDNDTFKSILLDDNVMYKSMPNKQKSEKEVMDLLDKLPKYA